jgi:exoribonuclease-2
MIEHKEQITMPDENLLKIMNEARRTNRMAERDVKDWLYVEFLEPEIEKKTRFEASIFEVSRGGFKAILEANGAMVFVPFSMMSDDKDALTLLGDTGEIYVNQNLVYRLGDKIALKVVEINKKTRSIIAAPCESVGGLMLPDPYAPKKTKVMPKRK